ELNGDDGGYEDLHVSTVAIRAAPCPPLRLGPPLFLAGGELGLGEPVIVDEVVAVRPPVPKCTQHDPGGRNEGIPSRNGHSAQVQDPQHDERDSPQDGTDPKYHLRVDHSGGEHGLIRHASILARIPRSRPRSALSRATPAIL